MRFFNNGIEAKREILRDIQERGVWIHTGRMQDKETTGDDSYSTRELLNYTFCIVNVVNPEKFADEVRCTKEWADAEFKERVSEKFINPGEAWKIRSEVWTEYLEKNGGKFAYSYNNRIRTQIDNVISELKKHNQSRQAIISIYDVGKDSDVIGSDRVPCSMYYQFVVREDKINIIYNMRSCDYHLHFSNDMYLAVKLLHHVAEKVGLEVGNLYMNIGSMHIYKYDWDNTTF